MGKYLLYALGEIILVVLGILIALQINNANEVNKQRVREVQFLEGLKRDLLFEAGELDRFIKIRQGMVDAADNALAHFNGKPIENPQRFNAYTFTVGVWQEFQRDNNTYLELLNSGNLTIISNESIKNGLLNLDHLHKKIISNREHLRNDLEQYFYDPWFSTVDLDPLVQSFVFFTNNGDFDDRIRVSQPELDALLASKVFKNGFVVTRFTNALIIADYQEMAKLNAQVVAWIDEDIAKDGR